MKKVLGLLSLVAISVSMLIGVTSPANADAASDDSTLSALSLSRGWVSLNGSFDPARTYYDVFTPEDSVVFSFSAANADSTIQFNEPSGTSHDLVGSGTVDFALNPSAGQIATIKVTSPDNSKSSTYTFSISSKVMPQPELVSFGQTKLPNSGGLNVTALFKHIFAWSNECWANLRSYYLNENGEPVYENFSVYNVKYQSDGNALLALQNRPTWDNFRYTGKSDLVIENSCGGVEITSGQWKYSTSRSEYKNYLTFENPSVTSSTIPDQITFGSIVDAKGFGINDNGEINVYLEDPTNNSKIYPWNSWTLNNSWGRWRIGGHWDVANWSTTKPVDVVIENYDDETGKPSVVLLRKRVTFLPFTSKNVSVSPAKGPISGGNVLKIQGFALCNNYLEQIAHVYIGGVEASTGNWQCGYESASDGYNFDGVDRATVVVPAGTKAGQVAIEVDNGFGKVTLPTKYTYGAKPTVSSVSPSTVANTGFSVITINGSDFGISGTPTVTIDGIKSPWVQRVSTSKLLAMVPATAGKTGQVELNVISSSGGGGLDVPSSINLVAATSNPTITSVSPSQAGLAGGDTLTIQGTGFAANATGVLVGEYPASIISSSSTEISVELPTGDIAGAVSITLGTPSGAVTKTNAFTYSATPGITSVSPSVIASSSSSANSKVTITGVGFGSTGTIKVGSQAPVSYTATANGTVISNINIPTSSAGTVTLLITPKSAKTPFSASVTVTAPKITYFGPNPKWDVIGSAALGSGYAQASAGTAGGEKFLIEGSGFGASGKVKIGTTLVTPTTYSDSVITFLMPAKQSGTYDISVVPTAGGVSATIVDALGVASATPIMSLKQIASVSVNLRSAPSFTFDPTADSSDLFEITGTKLNGTDSTKTRVYVGDSPAITPVSVTATSVVFHAPRNFSPVNWQRVTVSSNSGSTFQDLGILYVGNVPPPTTMSPGQGLCLKNPLAGRNPAQLVASGDGVFGNSGTVSIDGTNFPASAISWSANQVVVNFSGLSVDLANPWGGKTVIFTPDDSTKVPQSFGFNCAVDASVQTKLSGNSSELTIQAGNSFTASALMEDPLPGSNFTPGADGYLWQTAEDHTAYAWGRNVRSGLPVAAGEYYVKVNIGAGTYDRTKYATVRNSNEVHLVIQGTSITFTPKLTAGGSSKQYKGQLGDGSNGTFDDISYTVTQVPDAITSVSWQYRNHTCALADPNYGWSSGLPRDVAIAISACGGDDSTVSSWDIRVAGFRMDVQGVDKSIYYLPTYNTFNLTITKKSVTATGVRSEKIYDGNNTAVLGEITLTGAIDGDNVTLDPQSSQGATFSDSVAGTGKRVSLTNPLSLSAYWRNNYTLTNPNLVITGKISKADAKVKLSASSSSVIMSNPQAINVTVENTDTRTGQVIDVAAGVAPVVVSSKTGSICSYNSGTVTALKPGDCIIEARQAASTNYNAAVSWHDDSTTVEQIVIKVYPAPKTLSVVADDITVAVGEAVNPSAVVTGLLDGDGLDGFGFDYYQGSTKLDAAPSTVGTYKIVPTGGNLVAADSAAYTNAYKYVSGKLVITPAPPTISALSPNHGPEAGGNMVKITGEGLGQVTTVVLGEFKFRKPSFTVNGSGTEITFKAPKGVGVVDLVLKAGNATVNGQYIYDAPPVVTAPLSLKLTLKVVAGNKLVNQEALVTATGLLANSEYNLYAGSTVIFTANTNLSGAISKKIKLPNKACAVSGKQEIKVIAKSPAGTEVTDSGFIVTDANCQVSASAVQKDNKSWTLSGFLFEYNKYDLTAGGVNSLNKLISLIKGAKTVTIYGYTETDTKSPAVKKANLILASNRCETVRDFLKSKGIKAIYKTYGKGGVNPVSLVDQSKNRRVVIEASY